jgi:hypothetical protein
LSREITEYCHDFIGNWGRKNTRTAATTTALYAVNGYNGQVDFDGVYAVHTEKSTCDEPRNDRLYLAEIVNAK